MFNDYAVGHVFSVAQNFTEVKPSPRQVAWQDLEIGGIIHFGPNTFLDQEWGDSKADFSIPHLWIPNCGCGLPSPPQSQDALATGRSAYQDSLIFVIVSLQLARMSHRGGGIDEN